MLIFLLVGWLVMLILWLAVVTTVPVQLVVQMHFVHEAEKEEGQH